MADKAKSPPIISDLAKALVEAQSAFVKGVDDKIKALAARIENLKDQVETQRQRADAAEAARKQAEADRDNLARRLTQIEGTDEFREARLKKLAETEAAVKRQMDTVEAERKRLNGE